LATHFVLLAELSCFDLDQVSNWLKTVLILYIDHIEI